VNSPPQAQLESATREVLAGLVERVTFHNAENGFCVLRIKARGHRELITVIGHAAVIAAGEWVTASGEWVNDRTHGQQFKSRFMRTSAPTTTEGIEKYLGSGMIRGIGPVYAKKMVKAFGEKVFDIIEAEPQRLREVTGIGPMRAKRITGAWAEQKIVREIMVFLHSHGVGTARAVRIFKTYGADAVQVMTENPYRLARDIRAKHKTLGIAPLLDSRFVSVFNHSTLLSFRSRNSATMTLGKCGSGFSGDLMKLRFGVSLVACCSMALCMTLFIDGCKKSSPTIKTDSGADWTTYGRTNDEQRFSPLNQINEQNIGQLGLLWDRELGTTRGLEATPLVSNGVIYTTGEWSVAYALDVKSGEILWTFDPKVPRARARTICCDAVNRGVALYNGKVYLGTLDGRLIALDAKTGKPVWDVVTIDQSKPYAITGAPRIAKRSSRAMRIGPLWPSAIRTAA